MDDTAIIVTPDRWLTWDIDAFVEALATRGIDTAAADAWFTADD